MYLFKWTVKNGETKTIKNVFHPRETRVSSWSWKTSGLDDFNFFFFFFQITHYIVLFCFRTSRRLIQCPAIIIMLWPRHGVRAQLVFWKHARRHTAAAAAVGGYAGCNITHDYNIITVIPISCYKNVRFLLCNHTRCYGRTGDTLQQEQRYRWNTTCAGIRILPIYICI